MIFSKQPSKERNRNPGAVPNRAGDSLDDRKQSLAFVAGRERWTTGAAAGLTEVEGLGRSQLAAFQHSGSSGVPY